MKRKVIEPELFDFSNRRKWPRWFKRRYNEIEKSINSKLIDGYQNTQPHSYEDFLRFLDNFMLKNKISFNCIEFLGVLIELNVEDYRLIHPPIEVISYRDKTVEPALDPHYRFEQFEKEQVMFDSEAGRQTVAYRHRLFIRIPADTKKEEFLEAVSTYWNKYIGPQVDRRGMSERSRPELYSERNNFIFNQYLSGKSYKEIVKLVEGAKLGVVDESQARNIVKRMKDRIT